MMNGRSYLLAALMLGAVATTARAQSATPPAGFADVFDELASLVDQTELSGMDMARGSYLATRYFGTGPEALPYVQQRFASARAPGEASMAGLYITIYGKIDHLYALRKELETNRQKRSWVYEICGNEENFFVAMENGETWRPLTRLIPSTSGPRNFAICCLHSKDPLVRKAGLYWGYWMQDATYWKLVHECAAQDADASVRKIAGRLKPS